jgi:hypothetical protein
MAEPTTEVFLCDASYGRDQPRSERARLEQEIASLNAQKWSADADMRDALDDRIALLKIRLRWLEAHPSEDGLL